MKNAMQLKAKVRNLSQEWNIAPQAVMQTYFAERLLIRISRSRHQSNFVLKGGFLIASITGHNSRSTKDLDATLQSVVLDEGTLWSMFEECVALDVQDGIVFEIVKIEETREDDGYPGYRISLCAHYETIAHEFHIDVTTGDAITPHAITYQHQALFDEAPIALLAYPVETVLAEKIETILRRVDLNTRSRDYYDVFLLVCMRSEEICVTVLGQAIEATMRKRGTEYILDTLTERLETIQGSAVLREYWLNYQSEFAYASDVKFEDTLQALNDVLLSAGLLEAS